MGCYINPKDRSKEDFLAEHGTQMPIVKPELVPKDHVAVCWVDNGRFTAAGIAFDENEMESFLQDVQDRPHIWFIVPTEKLRDVSELFAGGYYTQRFEEGRFS